ncbi:MAG: CDP-alcohol phosphatidyltransferase family protein [Eggerthellaceae bacterium]|nr:CDP-alcohol phosphatidyltransferase family protein [Eggerthellaceae bacterium]
MAKEQQSTEKHEQEQVLNTPFTIANGISVVRLCMVPVFLVLLMSGYNLASAIIFGVAAVTDFLDGQVARRTHTVSRLGQVLDPIIDCLLMISVVLGLLFVGRLPLWIVLYVLIREAFLIVGGGILIIFKGIRIPVIYPGKIATTLCFFGFAFLIFNWPLIPGLGWCDFSWLPGFNGMDVCWCIWVIYLGLCFSIGTTIYYMVAAGRRLFSPKPQEKTE